MDCSPPGSSVHGILQARVLEWVAISYSRGSSQPRDETHVACVSYIGRWIFYHCIIWKALTLQIMKVKVTQLCPTPCNPMDYTVHGILQARILEWVAFPFSKGIFLTQGLNPGLLHCRWILYQLSHQGSPFFILVNT